VTDRELVETLIEEVLWVRPSRTEAPLDWNRIDALKEQVLGRLERCRSKQNAD
jgi:hypothetical protein